MGRQRKPVDTSTYSGRLAEAIATTREQRKMTAEELAIACGVHEDAVRKWESNLRSPDPDTILVIAKALGVPIRKLMPPD